MSDAPGVPNPDPRIKVLQWVYATAITMALALLWVAALVDDPGDSLPEWFGAAGVAAVAVAAYFVSRYYRGRPLEEPGMGGYTVTVLFRVGLALLPAVAGFVLFLLTGAWWVQLLGVVLSLPGFLWSVPSAEDHARHRALATQVEPHPPDEEWGIADPEEPAPWDDEHGGHGHGLAH